MKATSIIKCDCRHAAQDKFHGDGRRVHNKLQGKRKDIVYRCTVCKKEKSAGESV